MGAYKILGKADQSVNDSGYKILGHADEEEMPQFPELQMPETEGLGGVMQDVAAIPGKLLKFGMAVPEKAGESVDQITHDKMRTFKNLLAGSAEWGKRTINATYDLNQYLGKKNLLPEISKKLGQFIPHIPEETGAQKAFLGEPKPGDELLQLLPQLIMGKPIGRVAASEIPLTKKFAAINLKDAKKMAKEAGIKHLDINPEMIQEASNFLKDSKYYSSQKALDDLSEKAKSGDYDALFTLQSDMEKASRNLTNSAIGSDRNQGRAGYALRQNLLDKFRGSLKEAGHEKIANKMKKGQKKYRQYHWLDENFYKKLREYKVPLTVAGALGWGAKKTLLDNED